MVCGKRKQDAAVLAAGSKVQLLICDLLANVIIALFPRGAENPDFCRVQMSPYHVSQVALQGGLQSYCNVLFFSC
jgi:hypothetical protein